MEHGGLAPAVLGPMLAPPPALVLKAEVYFITPVLLESVPTLQQQHNHNLVPVREQLMG